MVKNNTSLQRKRAKKVRKVERKIERRNKIKANISKIKGHKEKIHSKAKSLNHKQREARRRIKKKALELAIRRDVQKKLFWLGIFFGIGFILWLFFSILYSQTGFHLINWVRSLSFYGPFFSWVQQTIAAQTSLGFYLLFSIAALFFFPSPLELIYFGFLQQGVEFSILFLATLLGIITAQHVNYLMGRFFGNFLHRFIRKKSRERLKYILHEKGGYAIFIIHMLPLPYALLNFVVGVAKYPYRKWIVLMLPALVINYLIFYCLFLVVF